MRILLFFLFALPLSLNLVYAYQQGTSYERMIPSAGAFLEAKSSENVRDIVPALKASAQTAMSYLSRPEQRAGGSFLSVFLTLMGLWLGMFMLTVAASVLGFVLLMY